MTVLIARYRSSLRRRVYALVKEETSWPYRWRGPFRDDTDTENKAREELINLGIDPDEVRWSDI